MLLLPTVDLQVLEVPCGDSSGEQSYKEELPSMLSQRPNCTPSGGNPISQVVGSLETSQRHLLRAYAACVPFELLVSPANTVLHRAVFFLPLHMFSDSLPHLLHRDRQWKFIMCRMTDYDCEFENV